MGRIEGRHANASGLHQRADFELRQITFVFGAAVFDHRHVAALADFGLESAQPRQQRAPLAVGAEHFAARLKNRRAGLQPGGGPGRRPAEQLLQVRRGIAEQHRHPADEGLESRVRAHDEAAGVENEHAAGAQLEPLREFVDRAVGLRARLMFGGRVLQQRQHQHLAGAHRQRADGQPKPALATLGVDQSMLQRRR